MPRAACQSGGVATRWWLVGPGELGRGETRSAPTKAARDITSSLRRCDVAVMERRGLVKRVRGLTSKLLVDEDKRALAKQV